MAKGDHVRVSRGAYSHHGIDVGGGKIVHFSGGPTNKRNATIRKVNRASFAAGGKIEVVRYGTCYAFNVVAQRAESRIGEDGYDLFGNNCEHFARWCKTGEHKSEQVKDGASGAAGGVGVGAATVGGVAAVGGAGAAAGLSGAGVMSGLASFGGLVGGGAVAGVGVLGAAPAAAATVAMRKILEDDESLDRAERDARSAGRTATAVGAVAGAAGTVGTIAAAGSVAGLSAPGIATGLAAMGGAVGGGMAAGAGIAIAAPAAAAAAVGYGVYRVWKWLDD